MSNLLKISNLSKRFGGLAAVNGLSFHVDDNEIVGLIGPNGAGKTTAVNLISGLIAPSGGEVHFNNEEITHLRPSQLAGKGLVRTFQHTALYAECTVFENARRGTYLRRYPGFLRSLFPTGACREKTKIADDEAMSLLELFGLDKNRDTIAGSMPYGYQKVLGIVLALAARPRLILLDEPVAGLSAEETDSVRDVILRIRSEGISVVVIEHNMRFISSLCDRVVVVNAGETLAEGTPQEVLRDKRVIEAYLGADHDTA